MIIQGDNRLVLAGMEAESVNCTVIGMGINSTGYPGAFTPVVERLINNIIGLHGKHTVLHLFSGRSDIGDERVDLERQEATLRENVLAFISRDKRDWDFVVLDPPYEIQRKSKLAAYGSVSSVAADVIMRRALASYLREHANEVVWLDGCAPLPAGFARKHLWLLLPGSYHTVRVLSWLTRKPSLFGKLAQENVAREQEPMI